MLGSLRASGIRREDRKKSDLTAYAVADLKEVPMQRLFTFLVVAAAASACTQPTDLAESSDQALGPSFGKVASGGPDAVRVNGFGHQGSGNTIRTFSFSAVQSDLGETEGFFELHARQAGARLRGEITCSTVWGRSAWMGGVVTSPGPFEGREAVFRTIDTGAGTKGEFEDYLSFLRLVDAGEAQEYCDFTPPSPPFFGAQGNITVMTPGETSFTDVEVVEWTDFPVFVPCALDGAGEMVYLSGTFHNLFHVTEDRAGGTTIRYQLNPQNVTGVGETSGDTYQGTGGSGGHSLFTISGVPYTDTFVDNFRIIGQGSGNNLLVNVRGHFTVNARGDVTVSNFEFSESCR